MKIKRRITVSAEKKCKKCQRLLPEGYKYKYCENCRNKQVDNVRNGIKIGVVGTLSAVAFILSKGKIGGIGKDA